MGWTSCHLEKEWKDGKFIIDRKAECDRILTQKEDSNSEVLKSAMVGGTYYAAVKTTDKEGNCNIWAAVFLTRIDQNLYYNFSYKGQDETCGPLEVQCPKGILNLLTDTDSEYAKDWRERCLKYHEFKRDLNKLPIGSKIKFCISEQHPLDDKTKKGDQVVLTKVVVTGKKHIRRYWSDGKYRWTEAHIPQHYIVVA